MRRSSLNLEHIGIREWLGGKSGLIFIGWEMICIYHHVNAYERMLAYNKSLERDLVPRPLNSAFWKLMKRHILHTLLAVAFLLALLAGLYQIDGGPFRFLRGHPLSTQFQRQYANKTTYDDFYSFPADFNAVCREATTELISLGYAEVLRDRVPNYRRRFETKDINLDIWNGQALADQANPRSHRKVPRPGSVLVRVHYSKPKTLF